MNLSELRPQCLIHLLSSMLFAKNNEELWPALGEQLIVHAASNCINTPPPPRDSGNLWENSGADFIHWSPGHSFTLIPAARSRCWPNSSPPPPGWWMCTHTLLHNDPLAYFTLQPCYSVAVDGDSDLCDSYVTLIAVCTLYCDSLCTYVKMCCFVSGLIKALSSRLHLTFLNSFAGVFSH